MTNYQLLSLLPDHDFSACSQTDAPIYGCSEAYPESMNTFSGETVLPANRITYMDTCQRECEWLIKDEITVGKFCRRLDDKEYAEYED